MENNLNDRTKFFITQQCALVYLEKWRNRRYGAVGLMMCSLLNSGRMIAGIRERNVANVFFFSEGKESKGKFPYVIIANRAL